MAFRWRADSGPILLAYNVDVKEVANKFVHLHLKLTIFFFLSFYTATPPREDHHYLPCADVSVRPSNVMSSKTVETREILSKIIRKEVCAD